MTVPIIDTRTAAGRADAWRPELSMFELDLTLVQHTVDRAMATLPHNINAMDTQGMITGSGDSSHLHIRHEGA